MIALGKEQLHDHAPVLLQTRRLRGDLHALLNQRDACRLKARSALEFHEAEAARARFGEPVEVAECGDGDGVFARGIQDGLVGACADVFAIDH